MKAILRVLALACLLVLAALLYFGLREDSGVKPAGGSPVDRTAQQARGAYLARAGNCIGCHTAQGGAAYAGGRPIATPFGTIYASNLTPDADTGLGKWHADDFWRALHNGKSRDGHLLYPAFPFPNYTRVSRADADALFAYLQSLPPVKQPVPPPALRFPYNQRWLLVGWRALYFRPGSYVDLPQQSADWNRGAYLVQGLGHCSACHTARNAFGASEQPADLRGGMIPMLDWYAPALSAAGDTGAGSWETAHLTALLKTGVSLRGAVFGPMAEVVQSSLQYLSDADLRAMALYLQSLPPDASDAKSAAAVPSQKLMQRGAALYEKHCVDCHKPTGQGAPPAYPSLAGNSSLQLDIAANPIRMVLHGGYPPSTTGNPYPYGMPPFGTVLDDDEIAAVLSYIRNAWGNQGTVVTAAQVNRYRAVPLE